MDYNTLSGINEYIEMADGYNGEIIIDALCHHIPETAQVLELGMGPGVDFKILSQHNPLTGSDKSKFFIDRYQKIDPYADLLVLDAIKLDTSRTFDTLYSNKVLHHFTQLQLQQSFENQAAILNEGGVICHSFWCGSGSETIEKMLFNYYEPDDIIKLISASYTILECEKFTEMESDDSFYIIAKKQ